MKYAACMMELRGRAAPGVQLQKGRRSMAVVCWQAPGLVSVIGVTHQCVKKHRNI